jgi:molybdopterin molybdotransferase
MTGAPIPEDCDAVIGQEDTDYGESTVNVYISVAPYENYCRQGEDYRRGDILLPDRTHIGPVETGIIGSLGIAEADVYRKPRVLLMSTGDELVMPGSELTPGKIYDSNLFTFEAMLRDWGAEVVVAIHSSDDPEDAVEKITRYAESVDLIITTGGVSVGKKDIMHDVFRIMDVERIFWKIAMKPGMAMLSGIREETLYLALSGNPYAAFADMHLVVRQVICELTGDDHLQMIRGTAVLADSYKKSSPARRFVRAYVQDGVAHIEGHTGGNGDIAPGIGINALLDIPGDSGELRPGDKVSILYL